ncbi:MAG TPA: Holliday junction branch migration protein RuvA [Methylomusa anaerophila]|uniref:Holliday junction branch migration complex subunit RuvA n=1 Tax=Methylomusa anaerophila TaxID=1930071 RepID=A0A348AP61_9FIRM|nr:Holliday junction branch migration protein RuvA [Methylomusa anaerophila]BBB92859.1 Holliday junction ATP-dependent DNA helicase RuvA [Methylomusa anaerophila]HML87305.1 Holliday junction branch migration protein RuvA [Methylomusa anaerophila]
MIGYIKGEVSHLFPEYCFVDVQGIGYRICIPLSTRQRLSVGTTISLFTYLNVREDSLTLFGFFTEEEYDLFMKLIAVTGIGPKAAVSILSAIRPQDFYIAIGQKNIGVLTKIPGIGKKTAERMILELKDKIAVPLDNEYAGIGISDAAADSAQDVIRQTVQALITLGYNQAEIMPVIKQKTEEYQQANLACTVEQLIKEVLKDFGAR